MKTQMTLQHKLLETTTSFYFTFTASIQDIFFQQNYFMPKIFEYLSFIFRFYSNDHLPIHVHVIKQQNQSKCELNYTLKGLDLKWKKIKGFEEISNAEKKLAEKFIHKYHLKIVDKWNQFFIFGKKITCEKISKL